MKLYKICNKISLLLHVLASAAGYFVMGGNLPSLVYRSLELYDTETSGFCI